VRKQAAARRPRVPGFSLAYAARGPQVPGFSLAPPSRPWGETTTLGGENLEGENRTERNDLLKRS
jgi:hypothetical protein